MHPYSIHGAVDGRSPILLSSPHSGSFFPTDYLASVGLDLGHLRRLEDAHVGQLALKGAVAAGVPLVEATHGRAIIDLNRAESEYDPDLVDGLLPTAPNLTDRVRAGYGLVPRIAAPGYVIRSKRWPAADIADRIATLHRPWHQLIAAALENARARHGYAILIDLHSMPTIDMRGRPSVVVGDRFGQSASRPLVKALERFLGNRDLRAARNTPYAGGYMSERHGQPANGIHAIQIELDRTLYMNPHTLQPHEGFAVVEDLLADLFTHLVSVLPDMSTALFPPARLAAE